MVLNTINLRCLGLAFRTRGRYPRTGIIIMGSKTIMMAAVNLYEDEGSIWYSDNLPDDIDLFESNTEEKLWGYKFFLRELREHYEEYDGKNQFYYHRDNLSE